MNQKGFANIILVVVIVVLVGAVGYFALIKKSEPIAQQQTPTPTPTPTPKNETASWKTYMNTRFGFELTFTDAWKGYRVFSSEGSQGVGAPTYLDFSLSTTDKSRSVMNVTDEISGYAAPLEITVIAKDRSYQGTGVKITQDNDNAYYYTINNNLPNDLKQINFEISKIISTFKFYKSAASPTPPTAYKNYQLSVCGVNILVRTGQSVKTNTGNSAGLAWGQLTVGGAMPNSNLGISCIEKNKNPQSDTDKLMNDVSYVIGIQSPGSSRVDKSLYTVFDKQTLSSITDLYSARDRGYRTGSETIGFSNQNWIYTFSFLNPAEAKNQNSFAISVNP